MDSRTRNWKALLSASSFSLAPRAPVVHLAVEDKVAGRLTLPLMCRHLSAA